MIEPLSKIDMAIFCEQIKLNKKSLLEKRNLSVLFKQLPDIIQRALDTHQNVLGKLKSLSLGEFNFVIEYLKSPIKGYTFIDELHPKQEKVSRFIYLVMIFNLFSERIMVNSSCSNNDQLQDAYLRSHELLLIHKKEINLIINNESFFLNCEPIIIVTKEDKLDYFLKETSPIAAGGMVGIFLPYFIMALFHPLTRNDRLLWACKQVAIDYAPIVFAIGSIVLISRILSENSEPVRNLMLNAVRDTTKQLPAVNDECIEIHFNEEVLKPKNIKTFKDELNFNYRKYNA